MKKKDFKQEIFDMISNHLLKQNEKSIEGACCKYKNKKGLKCAAGILIPDNDYDPLFEGFTISDDSTIKSFFCDSGYLEDEIDLIEDFQRVHDETSPPFWKSEIKKLAKNHNLKYNLED